MAEARRLGRRAILTISIICGMLAGVFQVWVLWGWLGTSFWFFALAVPVFLVALQVVAGTVAVTLHKQFGDPAEPLLPDLPRPPGRG